MVAITYKITRLMVQLSTALVLTIEVRLVAYFTTPFV
jgi:hypothetical protein